MMPPKSLLRRSLAVVLALYFAGAAGARAQ